MIELQEAKESFILIGVSVGDTYKNGKKYADETEESLEELKELVKTAGASVCGTLIQNREEPDRTTYFGKGKVDENIKPNQLPPVEVD